MIERYYKTNFGDPDCVCRPIPTIEESVKQNMSTYIIWSPKSRLPPTVTHPSRPAAIKIAGKMAAENPGETFYVCKLTNSARKDVPVTPPVEYADLEKAEECTAAGMARVTFEKG